MALFVMTCIDHKDALDRRMGARPAHLDYVKANLAMLKAAGPLLDDDGQMAGSFFIIEAENKAAVEGFNAADPYVLANVFQSVDIRAVKITVGALA
jgi:uncharacterized protein YciI